MEPVLALSSDKYLQDECINTEAFHTVLDDLYYLSEHEPLLVGKNLSANWLNWCFNIKSLLLLKDFKIEILELLDAVSDVESLIFYQYSKNSIKAEIETDRCWLLFESQSNFTDFQRKTIEEISEHFKQALKIHVYFNCSINRLHHLYECVEKFPVCLALLDQNFKCQLMNEKLIELCNKDINLMSRDKDFFLFEEDEDFFANKYEKLKLDQLVLFEKKGYTYVLKSVQSHVLALAERGFQYALFVFPDDLNKNHRSPFKSENLLEERLVRLGLSNKEAALAMYIGLGGSTQGYADSVSRSLKTIQTQLKSIYKKCGLHGQKELILFIYSKRVDNFLSQLSSFNIGQL